jgi:hypothetical protein
MSSGSSGSGSGSGELEAHVLEARGLVEGLSTATLREILYDLGHRFQGGWGDPRIRRYALELQGLEYKNMRELIHRKGVLLEALRTVPRSVRLRLFGVIHRLWPELPLKEVALMEYVRLKTSNSLASYTDATTLVEMCSKYKSSEARASALAAAEVKAREERLKKRSGSGSGSGSGKRRRVA